MRVPFWAKPLLPFALAGCQTQVVNALEPHPPGPDVQCSPGYALAFDGVLSRVEADLGGNLPTGNTARTVEMWAFVRPTSWGVNKHTFFEYGVNMLHQAWAIDMEVFPRMQVYSWDDDVFFDTGLPETGGWLHVAATYDGSIMRAYVNGNQAGYKPATDLLATAQTTVKLGWSPSVVPPAFFDGLLDEVRIWKIARTADEIKRDMSVRLTGSEPWLVAYWHFDEGTGTVAHDASTLHNDATLEPLEDHPLWEPSSLTLTCP
jgi:hypothetical protein